LRSAVTTLNGLAAKYARTASFVFIYIAEAHACDEWPINQLQDEIPKHRTLDDRRSAANSLLRAFPLHSAFMVVLDTMDNEFDTAFASWPFRFWIVKDGKIALKPQPKDAKYDIGELTQWLGTFASDGL